MAFYSFKDCSALETKLPRQEGILSEHFGEVCVKETIGAAVLVVCLSPGTAVWLTAREWSAAVALFITETCQHGTTAAFQGDQRTKSGRPHSLERRILKSHGTERQCSYTFQVILHWGPFCDSPAKGPKILLYLSN